MKINFNLQMVAAVALQVNMYERMFITSVGQMFRDRKNAEEALRTLNTVIDDPDNYIGLLEMTKDYFTTTKLREYASDIENFTGLFVKGAKIPKNKEPRREFERSKEKIQSVDTEKEKEIKDLLGLTEVEAKSEADKLQKVAEENAAKRKAEQEEALAKLKNAQNK